MCEVYCETVRDLLNDGKKVKKPSPNGGDLLEVELRSVCVVDRDSLSRRGRSAFEECVHHASYGYNEDKCTEQSFAFAGAVLSL